MEKKISLEDEKEVIDWFAESSLIHAAELGEITYRDYLLIVREHIDERLGQMEMYDPQMLKDVKARSIHHEP